MKKKAAAAKLDQSHAPSFLPLRPTSPIVNYPPLRIIPYDDLMRQFHAARLSSNREKAEAILDKLRVEFGAKRPQGKLERDVEIASMWLYAELDRHPTIPELFRMVHGWDKSYTEMGVRTVVRRGGFRISPGKRGRPGKT